MPTGARQVEGYSEISEDVLTRRSIIREVSNKDVMGSIAKGTQIKVYVNALATIADYVPGTGVAQTADGSDYVTLDNLKEKGVNEILDGFTVENAPADLVVSRFEAAMESAARQIDIDGFLKMEADGTELVATGGAKPIASTIYADILAMVKALDEADAPAEGRSLIVTPGMRNLLLNPDSKVFLAGDRADAIQTSAFVGRFLDFSVFVSNNLPAGTNMIALQERGFAHTDEFIKGVAIVSLDGSSKFYGDSAVKGRWGFNSGAIRVTLIQVNNGAA